MNVLQGLVATKNHLTVHGWRQHVYRDPVTGRCCLTGAVGISTAGTDIWWEVNEALCAEIVKRTQGPIFYSVIDWNDADGRTESEVHDLLDRCIANYSTQQ